MLSWGVKEAEVEDAIDETLLFRLGKDWREFKDVCGEDKDGPISGEPSAESWRCAGLDLGRAWASFGVVICF